MISALHKSKEKFTLFDKIYLTYIFIYANIFISPLLAVIPFPAWKILTVFFFALLFISYIKGAAINKEYIYLFVITVILSCIPALFYLDIHPITHNMSFLLVLLMFCLFKEKYIEPFINVSTVFICLMLAGAYIGFVYAFIGGEPLFQYNGPEERLHYFYLTTSAPANASIGRFIRPGGIYDEPGSLSTFLCSICLLRTLYKRNENKTLFMLIAGLVTLSLFHIIILFCYSMYYIKYNIRKKSTWVYLIFIILAVLVLGYIFYDALEKFLFYRLKVDSSGKLSGNTRQVQMENISKLMDTRSFFWGLKDVYTNRDKYPFFNNTPLTPLVGYGIFVSWYYYIFLFVVFTGGLIASKYFYIFFAMCLVFLPHDAPDVLSYSFYFVLFFYCALIKIKKQKAHPAKSRF